MPEPLAPFATTLKLTNDVVGTMERAAGAARDEILRLRRQLEEYQRAHTLADPRELDKLRTRIIDLYEARDAAIDKARAALAGLKEFVEREEKEERALIAANVDPSKVRLAIAPKGGLSLYGFGKYPVTLYKTQWMKLLANKQRILDFLGRNASRLKDPPPPRGQGPNRRVER